jgi:acyl carrier protein
MQKDEFLRQLEDLIEAEPGSLSETSLLADIEGWDSMAIMGFIGFADEELGATPAPKAIKACTTVAELMALVGV